MATVPSEDGDFSYRESKGQRLTSKFINS